MRQIFGYLKVRPLAALLGGFLATTPAFAQQLPSGLQVAAGRASLQQNGAQLTVTNSNNAILNWNSFSIGAGNSVRFLQPGSGSQVLNRVVGNDPSSILGSLSSNGRVWLLNPNGVLFGANARIDVAGLVASTLNLGNSDWLAGRYLFTGGSTAAGVDNQGQIHTTLGGQVALIGGSVSNEGVIEAENGQIMLAAGQSVELVDTGAPNLAVKVTAPSGSALNLGSLSAGRIDVLAAAVNQDGLVQAENLSTGPAGEIVLQAGDRLTLAGGSATRADGAVGGNIKLLGSEIDLQNGSAVSASGTNGGGSILVGGGAQGQDPSVPNAQAVYVAPQASLSADALTQGDGGHIVVWSDVATRAYGSFSAHAGTEGGNGGLIETSGHWLDARPTALDVSAPKGLAGTWLLDPYNVTITDIGPNSNVNSSFTATGNDAVIGSDTIVSALNSGTNVTISTGSGGTQAGTIAVNNATFYGLAAPQPVSLTLSANSDINVTGSTIVNEGSGALSVVLKAGAGGAGAISVTGSNIHTNDGDITLGGFGANGAAVGNPAGLQNGVYIDSSTLDAGSGALTITGQSTVAGARGVWINTPASLSDPSSYFYAGNLTINGVSTGAAGVEIDAGTFDVGAGALTITGQSAVAGGRGVWISDPGPGSSSDVQGYFSAGTLTINGVSTGTILDPMDPSSGAGVAITAGTLQASQEMSITGTSSFGNGLAIVAAAGSNTSLVEESPSSAGLGNGITLNGTSNGNGYGVLIDNSAATSGSATLLQTDGPDVQITGSNTSSSTEAVYLRGAVGETFLGIAGFPDVGPGLDIMATGGGLHLENVTTGSSTYEISASSSSGVVIQNSILQASGGAVGEGGDITLRGGGNVSVSGSTIQSLADNPTSNMTVSSSSSLSLVDSSVSSIGVINLQGIDVSLAGATTVSLGFSPNLSTMLLISGPDGTGPAQSFENKSTAGGNAFIQEPSSAGRWIIWLNDATDASTLNLGGLDYDFKRYGAKSSAAWASDSGDGVVSYVNKTVTLNGDVASKTYDGTASTTVTGVTLTPQVSGDFVLGFSPDPSYAANFSDKNAGAGKRVTLDSFSPGSLAYSDGSGHSVYGYTFVNGLKGDIARAVLQATVTGVDKIYDGTTNAVVNISNVTGLVGDETVASTGVGSFADKNVGQAKPINVTYSLGNGTNGGLGSNYQLQPTNLVTASITPAMLSFTATGVSRPYDGTTNATANITDITGLVGNETVTISGVGSFADKNVGQAKPIDVNYTFSNGANGWLASNYQFKTPDSLTGSITPAVLSATVTGVDRIYDGTTAATVNIGDITGLVGNETIAVSGTGSFADKNVGQAKPITTNYTLGDGANGGLASNYQFRPSDAVTANITPATLTYTATPVSLNIGAALPTLNGTVTGFVGDESLETATTGSLAFAAGVNSTTVPGVYAIDGQGLSAANYDFVQALDNAVALTINDVRPIGPNGPLVQVQISAVPARNVGPAQTPTPNPRTSGLLDLIPAVQSAGSQGTGRPSAASFDSVPIDTLSPWVLSDLLKDRESLMQSLLRESLEQLKKDPTLADEAPCESLKEALLGTCIVTDALKAKLSAARVKQNLPSGSQGQPASPAQQAVANSASVSSELPPPLFSAVQVKSAALPEIRRKVAVLIGEGHYADARIPGLANTIGDAHAVATTLTGELGYETLVLDNPSKETLIGTLNRLALEIGPEDSAIVFYAGHGAVVDETHMGYWLASSSQSQDPKTWVSNADIGRLIEQIGAKQVVLISDSCYSGSLVAGARIRGTPGELNPADVLARRSAVVMSSGGNEPVFDSGRDGHSLFAWSLMNTLSQVKSWRPGGNLFERIRFTVARELPQRPQYGAAPGYQEGGDYLFEVRQLDAQTSGGKSPG